MDRLVYCIICMNYFIDAKMSEMSVCIQMQLNEIVDYFQYGRRTRDKSPSAESNSQLDGFKRRLDVSFKQTQVEWK